jgi:hypothetical protein
MNKEPDDLCSICGYTLGNCIMERIKFRSTLNFKKIIDNNELFLIILHMQKQIDYLENKIYED